MVAKVFQNVPETWRDLFELLAALVSWIPGMQDALLEFFLDSSSGWATVGKALFLLLPILLWLSGIWCTQLLLYTLPFRSGRLSVASTMLLAWWDGARMIWLYWVGLVRLAGVTIGWVFMLARLGVKLLAEAVRQIVLMPFTMTGKMTKSYFQPGVPWIAFLMLLFWCLLEALIFTYTLFPTVSEVMIDLAGAERAPKLTWPLLYFFLFALIMGSFACIHTLTESFSRREYRFLVQMILVEMFVMLFEVLFLYRELVDSITPWIAQQTGVKPGLTFTLSLATFGWIGVRGMNWFLFGRYGAPPLLAFISRQPLAEAGGAERAASAAEPSWWRPALEDFKREIAWLHERSEEVLEYLALPVLHLLAAALNFGMILVTSRPVFSLPFKGLKDVMETREILARLRPQVELRPHSPAQHATAREVER
jgi:hypothetical protein